MNEFKSLENETPAPTCTPVTTGGWYEHTDGTWSDFCWVAGRLHTVEASINGILRPVDHVSTETRDMLERERARFASA